MRVKKTRRIVIGGEAVLLESLQTAMVGGRSEDCGRCPRITRITTSVGRGTLDVVDDKEFDGAFGEFEFEAELLLEGDEHGGAWGGGWMPSWGHAEELELDVE